MSMLDNIILYAKFFQILNPMDSCIIITNHEGTVVCFVPSNTFNLNLSVGSKVAPEGSIARTLKTKSVERQTLPKKIYGAPIKAISIPLLEEGVFVGVLATATSLIAQENLENAAHTIAATSEQINATTQELAGSATELANHLAGLTSRGENIVSQIKKTDEILRFVSDVAVNSNLLGLNAAIEAARAGEHGRGFSVVAEEIRKMADNSGKAVKDINQILLAIQKDVKNMVQVVQETSIIGERQASASEEISASMDQLVTVADNIEKLATLI
ncbi:methyl-accepting chemotaxis protein [Heliophilum fasciatum]|uniref:Methyl-accepting chemotaxis protein (MCP) signaling protein n=1 Tax=Heliophilum fasciatum TaxID=35700 RepID=A0A4R2RBH8_9FIRM|nr:methyl-accepting chemotaxis protein [Heliophilum fasciatum]MCW2279384.1 uncharacterized protein YukE [Heliophilum fasciatum]TCP60103.1 methyl-accepting chemotaxis protein (MCP) signaling protein [Heliophilum fasciatum]